MSSIVPELDAVDFEALVDEARSLIVRYAPDWTDHNLHDPGITLLELLAWIADQQIYQAGFVGDRHLAAFAALLGVRSERALPARGLLWLEGGPGRAAVIEAGTAVVAIRQPEIPYLVERRIQLAPVGEPTLGMASFQLRDFNSRQGASVDLAGTAAAPGEGLTLAFVGPVFDPSLGPVPVALGIEVEADPAGATATDARSGQGPLVVEHRSGVGGWQALEVIEDDTQALARTGFVLLAPPPTLGPSGPSALRLRLDRGFFAQPPKLVRIALNVVPIAQLESVAEGVLGRSNGQPDQRFTLALDGLALAADPDIATAGAGVTTAWTAVADLTPEGPTDRVYRRLEDADAILFGNGVNGAVPPEGHQVLHGPYRRTRGEAGNLAAGHAWQIAGLAAADGAWRIANPHPLAGGRPATSIESLIRVARRRAVTRTTLSSNADLLARAEALLAGGVERALVLQGFHPATPDVNLPRTRTLALIPKAGLEQPESWRDRFVAAVRQALDADRVLGERLSISLVRPVPIHLEATLEIAPGAEPALIQAAAMDRLRARLSDTQRSPDIEPWPIGQSVSGFELAGFLAPLPGVVAVRDVRIATTATGPKAGSAGRRLALARDEVAVLATASLAVQATTGPRSP
jgi:hypothetical protein